MKTSATGLRAQAGWGICGLRDGESPHANSMTREHVFFLDRSGLDEEKRTVELSFSSSAPYERWWGFEILDHGTKSVRLGRLNGSAAVLVNHKTGEHVGVVESAKVDGEKGRAVVRFGKSALAEEIFQDVKDGIRKLVSVGYRIHEIKLESEKDGQATYRVIDWEPYEISIVSIPADTTIGVGRDGQPDAFDPRNLVHEEEDDMRFGQRNDGGQTAAPTIAVAAAAAPAAPVQNEQRSAVATAPAPTVAAAPAGPTVDEVRTAERERIANIRAMGERLNARELADAAIADGRDVGAFVRDYNGSVGQAQAVRTAEAPVIGMSERDIGQFSFVRLMNHLANPNDRNIREAAAFELECSSAARAARDSGEIRGETVPLDVLRHVSAPQSAQRDLTVGTATAGGHTVATNLLAGSFIDLLRASMALTQLGVRMLTDLNGNLAIPRQTGGATAYWVAESGAPTESAAAFDQVALTPKTVGAFSDISRRLLLQSSIDVENFVRQDLATVLAMAIDLAGINGSGSSNQPRGILNTSGIGSVAGGTNGLAPAWSHIVNLESAVANQNAATGNLGYLTNTAVRGKLKQTERFSSSGMPVWGDDNTLNGTRAAISNQVPSNLTKGTASGTCSAIIYGNWADLIVGMWGGLDLMADPYTGSTTGTVRIVGLQDVDVAVRHAESFSAMVDALTA